MPESALTKPQLRESMLERAPRYYTNYPYHNFDGHVMQTIRDFDVIYEWLEQQGIPIDYDIGVMAIAYHDARFHEDEKAFGFDTKEQFSASTAEIDLIEFGAPKDIIHGVTGAIIATTATEKPQNNLEKAVRLADVGNVSGDPKIFLYNTYLLLQESIRRGLPIPETCEQFCLKSQGFLNLYFSNSIQFEHEGKIVKYEPMTGIAQRNIRSLGTMTVGKLIDTVPNIEKTLPKIWFKK